ncbi:MAG: DNA repair protein RecN [Dehalococcoidia bacterium]|nr:DNA repair protein RecN [Dehalococcoidia bacterium]
MLRRLTIEDIGVIDRLDIPFDDGFTVLTGETGAGKSIIINCISLLLGTKADGSLVRSGTEKARIEAIFERDETYNTIPTPLLKKIGIKDGESASTLHITREIDSNGRGECAVNGHKVSLKALQEVGQYLAESHGQRQTLALLQPGEQREILDRYGELEEERECTADIVRQLRRVRSDLRRLRREEAKAEAGREELEFELASFREIAPVPGEDAALERERSRLSHAEQLVALAGAARSLLIDPTQGSNTVVDALGEAGQNTREAAALDTELQSAQEIAESLAEQAQDLALSLGRYLEGLEANPNRLEVVEERMAALDGLKRRHGGSLEDVIAWGERAEQELAGLNQASGHLAELVTEESRLNRKVLEQARTLSTGRSHAAARLGRAVEGEIETLALAGARIVVDVRFALAAKEAADASNRQEDVDALSLCDESGGDEVEILIAPNQGEPLRPLAAIASGGEMARVMLAVKTVLAVGDARTLALDEIDVGVGGHVGATIGNKLADLGRGQQVICVTHLPQVAAHADQHVRVFKRTEDRRTVTRIEHLTDDDDRAAELSKMIGSGTAAGRESMRELLDAARQYARPQESESGIVLRLLEAVG